jgi:hypothetical protein
MQAAATGPAVAGGGNPWVVRQSGFVPIPPGSYIADFIGVSEVTIQTPKGPGVRWRWQWAVATGQQAGHIASAMTECDISPQTLAGRLIAGLIGRDVKAGDDVRAAVEDCKGKRYLIAVQPGPKGGKAGVRMVGPVPTMA